MQKRTCTPRARSHRHLLQPCCHMCCCPGSRLYVNKAICRKCTVCGCGGEEGGLVVREPDLVTLERAHDVPSMTRV
jgi:hypothetical protein